MKRFVLPLVLLSGCIPMKKTFIVRPESSIRVVDGAGAPIEGASVKLVRNKYPYGRHDADWTATTNAKGEVSFSKEEKTETVYPLMMHGVPGYGFVACVESPGKASKTEHLSFDDAGKTTVTIKLVDGDRPCEGKADMTLPPPGKARVFGIERVDATTWKVDLFLPKSEPVAVGNTFGGLKIKKIEWQGEPIDTWRRATVQAEGPGEKVHFGDVLDRQ